MSASYDVETSVSHKLGGYDGVPEYSASYKASVFDRQSVFISSSNTNDQLRDFFVSSASEFAAKVIAARRDEVVRNYIEHFPNIGEPPMSEERWEEILSDLEEKQN